MELLKLDKPVSNTPDIDISCDRIRATDKILKQPAVLLVDGLAKLTKGNISAWKGKAKSKKTFALTLTIASLIKGSSIHEKFQPVSKGKTAWVDTEQSPFDAYKVVKRLEYMCGGEENLLFYGLRRYSPDVRVSKIEKLLLEHGDELDTLIIDGLRDLIYDINDIKECTNILTKLMAWSIDYDIHISVVLHSNKGDGNMRGHLGTELGNKCETVFSVTKDENVKDVSLITEDFGRGKEIEEFKLIINKDGIPEVLDDDSISYDIKQSPY